jgi:hypothetical protein
MSSKKDYKVTVVGTGLNFEQPVDMATASQIISLVMTGAVTSTPGGGTPQPHQTAVAPPAGESAPPKNVTVSLASYIKAKKGESNQNVRFLATAHWLSSRGTTPLTASAVGKALLDNHQKKIGNPADALNQNVGKGLAEKKGDGTFYITPEGLEALEGKTAK